MTTNKRFNPFHNQMTNVLGYECVFDDLERKWLSIRDVIILANKLNKENNELKSELEYYKLRTTPKKGEGKMIKKGGCNGK